MMILTSCVIKACQARNKSKTSFLLNNLKDHNPDYSSMGSFFIDRNSNKTNIFNLHIQDFDRPLPPSFNTDYLGGGYISVCAGGRVLDEICEEKEDSCDINIFDENQNMSQPVTNR